MKRLLMYVLVLVSYLAANTLEDCSSVTDKTKRLECYDKLYSHKVASGRYDNWLVSDKKTLMGDSRTVLITTNGTPSATHSSLVLRCEENKLEVLVGFSYTYLGSGSQSVRVKFDYDEPDTATWSISAGGRALFYNALPIYFVKKLVNHSSLVLEVSPYQKTKFQVKFNIRHLKNVIKPLQKACNSENWDFLTHNQPKRNFAF